MVSLVELSIRGRFSVEALYSMEGTVVFLVRLNSLPLVVATLFRFGVAFHCSRMECSRQKYLCVT